MTMMEASASEPLVVLEVLRPKVLLFPVKRPEDIRFPYRHRSTRPLTLKLMKLLAEMPDLWPVA